MSEDCEGSGVESEQELDGERDHGYHGDARKEGVRTEERKGGVWIVVGDSILRAKDMREGLQATVWADEVKVWGESGAKMRDLARLVEGQMGNVRKEGKKVEGIVLHVGTNDFGRGMNAAGMVMRAEQMAKGIEAIVGGVVDEGMQFQGGEFTGTEGLGNSCTHGHMEKGGVVGGMVGGRVAAG